MLGPTMRAVAVVIALWAWAPAAHAYLDPGAGSALLQAFIGGAALVAAAVAHQWHRLRFWFARRRPVVSDTQPER